MLNSIFLDLKSASVFCIPGMHAAVDDMLRCKAHAQITGNRFTTTHIITSVNSSGVINKYLDTCVL